MTLSKVVLHRLQCNTTGYVEPDLDIVGLTNVDINVKKLKYTKHF